MKSLQIVNYIRTQLSRSPFTVTGRLLAVSAAFSLFAIFDPSLSALFSYLLWILIIAFGFGMWFRPRLQVRSCWIPLVHAGQPVSIRLEVENTGRMSAFDMHCTLELPQEGFAGERLSYYVSALNPGETVSLTFSTTAKKRGVFALSQLMVASLFPLSLYRFLSLYSLCELIVVAPEYELESELADFVVEGLIQSDSTSAMGNEGLLEYVGSRDYRPGMAVRRWDFASWARIGTPFVREFFAPSASSVVIVVDTTQRRSDHEDRLLERVLTSATGVVMRLNSLGRSVLLVNLARTTDLSSLSGAVVSYEDVLVQLAATKGEFNQIDWGRTWSETLAAIPVTSTLVAILSDERAAEALGSASVGSRQIVKHTVSHEFQVMNNEEAEALGSASVGSRQIVKHTVSHEFQVMNNEEFASPPVEGDRGR